MNKILPIVLALGTGFALRAATVSEVLVKPLDGFGGEASSVLSRCQIKPGDTYDITTVTRDVATLNETQEFEEVNADAQQTEKGVRLVFYVKRKLRYQAPAVVTGAEFFSVSRIQTESGLKDGYLYGEGDLAHAAELVKTAYLKKCFPNVKVVALAEPIPGSTSCTVTFRIDEGVRQKVRHYAFRGVESVDEDELRESFGEYPWWNPYGWFTDDPVTPDQLAQCVSKIEAHYRDRGYLDVSVAQPERVPVGDGKCDIVFAVREGARYTVRNTSLTGLTRYTEENVRALSAIPEAGTVAGATALADAAHRIEVTVGSGDSGLADTHVDYKAVPVAEDENAVDVVFEIHEGVPVVIDEVLIRGNDYTKDKVIRREIALAPGDRMLADRAERSKHRLENLDYFSRVEYKLEKTDRGLDANGAEYRNLVYEVEEKNTGSFMVGIGASSVDSVYVSAELSQSNFDLFAPHKWFRGAGQKGRAYVQWGPRIQTIEASVTEPHLFDRLLELTVEGYRRGRWYDEYDLYRNGGAAQLTYPVKFWPTWEPFGRFGVRFSGEFIQFDDVEDKYYYTKGSQGKVSRYFKEQDKEYGDAAEGTVRFFWSHDTRDNFRMPTSGGRTQVFADLTGGDNTYWKLGFNHRQYFPVWRKHGHVLMAAVRAETVDSFDDDLPIYDKLFLGGPRSIRGVKYRNVSPMIKPVNDNDWAPIGGQTLFAVNFEYTIPVVKMLRLAAFTDLGSVGVDEFDLDFSDTFAWTVGLGIRLDIPMFPIRLDFATPVEKPDEADKEVFSFTVGYDF